MTLAFSGIVGERRKDVSALRLDDTVNGTVLYIGEARVGALTSDAIWRIQRITFTTPGQDDMDLEWADGNNAYNKVWDDRLGLSYS